jgi:hypothetical protein
MATRPDLQKAAMPMRSTEAGICICLRELQKLNAQSPMVNNPSGKDTLASRLHFLNERASMCRVPGSTIWLLLTECIIIFCWLFNYFFLCLQIQIIICNFAVRIKDE